MVKAKTSPFCWGNAKDLPEGSWRKARSRRAPKEAPTAEMDVVVGAMGMGWRAQPRIERNIRCNTASPYFEGAEPISGLGFSGVLG